MSNYNTTLQSNNTDLQTILQTLQTKATGGEQATPVISVNTSGLITATAGTKSSTHQLAFQPAKTITPSTASQIAVSSGYYAGGNITVAAIPSTYVQPTGTKTIITNGTHDVKSYASVSVSVASSSGDTNVEDGLITGAISGAYTNDSVTTIRHYAFYSCRSLTTVSFPAVTSIDDYAFGWCTSLTTASFPAATTIGSCAFSYCTSLTTASFPAATTIGSCAFYDCASLTTVSFPVATSIGSSAFANCYQKLVTVSFPAATTIGSHAFSRCYNLKTISFPAVTSIGNGAFSGCHSLKTISFPAVTSIGNGAFYSCYSLTTVSFPVATSIGGSAFANCYQKLVTVSFPAATTIGSYAFSDCYKLKSLYLTGSSVCKLSNSNAFSSTPIGGYSTSAGTYGSIYVPTSLLTSYKTATNWTKFSSRFVAYDGGGSNGDGANLITFTIDDVEYQAVDGMTWGDWIDSDYNVDNYRRNELDGSINTEGDNGFFVGNEYDYVYATDAIMNGYAYFWVG